MTQSTWSQFTQKICSKAIQVSPGHLLSPEIISYLSAVMVGHHNKWFFRTVKVVCLTYQASKNPPAYSSLCSLDLILAAFPRCVWLVPESTTTVSWGLKFSQGSVDFQAKPCSPCKTRCNSQVLLSTRNGPRRDDTGRWGWGRIALPMLRTRTPACRDHRAAAAGRLQSCFLNF